MEEELNELETEDTGYIIRGFHQLLMSQQQHQQQIFASSSSRRGFRTLALGLVVLGAYLVYRGGRKRGADRASDDFETSPLTRHLVDMRSRVTAADRDKLKVWLDEQEKKEKK